MEDSVRYQHLVCQQTPAAQFTRERSSKWCSRSIIPVFTINNFRVHDASEYAIGKAWLNPVMWNSRLYIHTGLSDLQSIFNHGNHAMAALNSLQMSFIASKLNYPVIDGNDNGYPLAFEKGQKVLPVALQTNVSLTIYIYSASQGVSPSCTISDGAGGYKYNTANNGNCNMLWQLDY